MSHDRSCGGLLPVCGLGLSAILASFNNIRLSRDEGSWIPLSAAVRDTCGGITIEGERPGTGSDIPYVYSLM